MLPLPHVPHIQLLLLTTRVLLHALVLVNSTRDGVCVRAWFWLLAQWHGTSLAFAGASVRGNFRCGWFVLAPLGHLFVAVAACCCCYLVLLRLLPVAAAA